MGIGGIPTAGRSPKPDHNQMKAYFLYVPPHRAKSIGWHAISWLFLAVGLSSLPADTIFYVATYNLENYLDRPSGTRKIKPQAARAKIRETILEFRPDVLALQEIGSAETLMELKSSLMRDGLRYPYWEHVKGFDTNLFVAVLSRFPITNRQPHETTGYVLNGRRLRVSRGFAEVDIQVNSTYSFKLITAHLKSKSPVGIAHQADMREKEALQLRRIIDQRLKMNRDLNLVLLGDFNDVANAKPVRILRGIRKWALQDVRPAERNGDNLPQIGNQRKAPRTITWTHHYGLQDTYSRLDYILLSPGMAREWIPELTFIPTIPNWGQASDHRPLVAGFLAPDP